jgi:hypothetical protein
MKDFRCGLSILEVSSMRNKLLVMDQLLRAIQEIINEKYKIKSARIVFWKIITWQDKQ